jgi:hypothetical protein
MKKKYRERTLEVPLYFSVSIGFNIVALSVPA